MKTHQQFSVLMSVYRNEKVEYFVQALNSVLNQSIQPSQVVLVRDGVVDDDLQNSINEFLQKYPTILTYVPLEENVGLGRALCEGLVHCEHELVARMDTDDICVFNRFEKQLQAFEQNPDIDIVGGNIAEFSDSIENVLQYRVVEQEHSKICAYLKKRNPFNHMTVMFKKDKVLSVNSYEDFFQFEDWFLWTKLYLAGAKFANLNEVLVFARISQIQARRGGWKYYRSSVKFLKFMKANKIIGQFEYLKLKFVRFVGHVLLPNKIREWAYKKFLRKQKDCS